MRPRACARARLRFVSIFKFTVVVLFSFIASTAFAATQWEPAELAFDATQSWSWNSFPLRVDFVNSASGRRITVDGYWNGGSRWVVRYALPETGTWNWTASSNDAGLRGSGSITVNAPSSSQISANRNYRGHIKVGPTSRYFVHADGTPFFYLGDTLWAVNSTNANANSDGTGNFYTWANDRKNKRFTVAQVATFIEFDNEGGTAFPNGDWSNLNVGFFQASDRRFSYLWQQGFIVAMHPTWITTKNMTLQQAIDISRYIYARYGAHNLVWSLSGEFNTDGVQSSWSNNNYAQVRSLGSAVKGFNDIAYRHPVSVHPAGGSPSIPGAFSSHYLMQNESWLDHNWLQTFSYVERIPFEVNAAYSATPAKPVVLAEPCYENSAAYPYFETCTDAFARLEAWSALLSGAAGHVYGAKGVFYLDDMSALNLPGSGQLSNLAAFMNSLNWWELDKAADCVMINGNTPSIDPNTTATRSQPRCMGKSGAMYVTYIPEGNSGNTITFRNVPNGTYVTQWFNPRTGAFSSIGSGPVNGIWQVPPRPDGSDWVVLMKRSAVTGSTSFIGGAQATIPGTIQAEDFDNGGEGVGYHDSDSSNNGGAYRSEGVDIQVTRDSSGNYDVGWTRAGEWLQYTVNVAAPGTYTVELRVASDGPGGTFHIEFGGQDKTGPISVPNTGGWQTWQTLTRTVNLSAGQLVMRVVMDVASSATLSIANLNYFRFTPGAAIPGTIQAEDFDAGGEGVGYHDTDPSNNGGAYRNEGVDIQVTKDTGGGYDVGWTRAGEWLRYTVNVAASGTYTLQARVASDGPGGTFHVEFNGVDVTGPMTVPNTGGWEVWQTITRQVTLNAGLQTMRIVMDSASSATNSIGNLNYIRF